MNFIVMKSSNVCLVECKCVAWALFSASVLHGPDCFCHGPDCVGRAAIRAFPNLSGIIALMCSVLLTSVSHGSRCLP